MIKIEFPDHHFKVKKQNDVKYIFDDLRKSWLKLTPEEWVRQNFVRYLVIKKNYPPALVALEKTIRLGELLKRFDILVYDRDHQPWMMIECKAMDISLGEAVLSQVLRYNIAVPVTYMVITNGEYCSAFKKQDAALMPLSALPEYGE